MDEKTRAHVEKLVAEWPPLSDEQIHKVAALLRPAAEKLRAQRAAEQELGKTRKDTEK